VTVIFGGFGDLSTPTHGGPLDLTFTWDGREWSRLSPATAPSPRFDHAMVWDSLRRRIVMFGGLGVQYFGDTWSWDGVDWSLLAPANVPSPRAYHGMAFDRRRGEVVLFGGSDGPGILGDTWMFDGVDWQQRAPSVAPPAMINPWMTYDEARERVVLLAYPVFAHWEWDGATWEQRFPDPHPQATTSGGGFTYDSGRQRCVFTVAVGSSSTWTWEWDGNAWLLRTATMPVGIYASEKSYDRARHRVVSTGGQSCDQTECFLINSVWEYFVPNPASALPFGAGCAGSLGVLALRGTSLPWLGSELVLDLTPVAAAPAVAFGVAGASNTQLGSTPLPLSLAPLGLPACSLLTSSEVVVPLVTAQAHASWEVPCPRCRR